MLPQVDRFFVEAVTRVRGAFASIDAEAEAYGDAMFQSYGNHSDEGDLGDYADSARDQAVDFYVSLRQLEQSLVNLLAAGLYHLFEQHRRRLRGMTAKDVDAMMKASSHWGKVNELRLVANAVKHGSAESARALHAVRPDLLVDPIILQTGLKKRALERVPGVIVPLGGDDLFLSQDDLEGYRDALYGLWQEMASKLP
ncbi:MAG: hypothetical protein SFU84_14605 [Gemmatimonadales bacterium]|nr:hypothetical protein [Gemmatimonadales bacterium]